MNELERIQKIARAGKIIARICMTALYIVAFIEIAAGSALITLRETMETDFYKTLGIFSDFGEQQDIIKISALMFANAVTIIRNAILATFVYSYLKNEISDGTPFTMRGAKQLFSLGIKTIVTSLIAATISSVICAIFDVEASGVENMVYIMPGIMLMALSLIFRYGAKLEQNKEDATE